MASKIKGNTATFTPELFVSAPRRSTAVPNEYGTHALYTESTYTISTNTTTTEIRILDLETQKSTLFSDDDKVEDPQWLVGNAVFWLKYLDDGKTEIWTGDAVGECKAAYLVGRVSTHISDVKVKVKSTPLLSTISMAFSAPVCKDGTLLNPKSVEKPASSAREFDDMNVRFWDRYKTPYSSSLWYTTLRLDHDDCKDLEGRWVLRDTEPIVNVLKGSGINFPLYSHEAFGAPDSYDISPTALIINAVNPEYNPAEHISTDLWCVRLTPLEESATSALKKVVVDGWTGSVTAAAFSRHGSKVAFVKQKTWQSAYPPSSIFIIKPVEEQEREQRMPVIEVQLRWADTEEAWDLSPNALLWSDDDQSLYVTAEDRGYGRLFKVDLQNLDSFDKMFVANVTRLTSSGVVSEVYRLGQSNKILVNSSSMIDSNICTIQTPSLAKGSTRLTGIRSNGKLFGLCSSQVSQIQYPGAGDYECQCWVVTPHDFDPKSSKSYPVAFLLHGGPQSSWSDSWSYRWNPSLFAEQGYVVVAPNPTGSTGFGHKFVHDIEGDWGGRCYEDIVKCFAYVKKNLPFADTRRAVALGASFGGYMINWMAGQPLGREFKALVCHDGIFSNTMMLSCDVPGSLVYDMGGPLWTSKQNWDKYDPSCFTQHWATPMLIIHSDKDYRCPMTDGLAVFNVCQMKGIESKFLNFPDETHFVTKRANSLYWYKTVLGWINKFTSNDVGVRLQPVDV